MIFPTSLKQTKVAVCLSLSLLAFWDAAPAQDPAATRTHEPSSDRFLLVVETSADMQPRVTNALQTVGRLFADGLNGQLHAGGTIGLWTYDRELHTGKFPLQHWSPTNQQDIAQAITQFLEQQTYDQPSRWAPVVVAITNVAARSDRITVLLLSAGGAAPAGMPFAAQIADAYKHNAATQQERAMPFVTIWRAVRGTFTGFTVSTPPEPVVFPTYTTNPIVASPPAPDLIVIGHDSPPPTNPPVVTNVAAPAATHANEVVATVTNSPPIVSNGATVSVAKTNRASAPPDESPVIPKPHESKLPLILILAGVVVAMAVLVAFCLARLQRSRVARASLITRTMNSDKK